MTLPIGPANLIKAKIKTNLDALVTSGVLGSVIERDINTDILKEDFPTYPCAVLGTSNMESVWEYQTVNKVTYRHDILVVVLQDNLTSLSQMEDIRDAVALQFDNNFTLTGDAPLGISAVYSDRAIVASGGKNFVLFNVTLKATTFRNLIYNF